MPLSFVIDTIKSLECDNFSASGFAISEDEAKLLANRYIENLIASNSDFLSQMLNEIRKKNARKPKPCPFCGDEPLVCVAVPYYIECKRCNISTGKSYDLVVLVDKWNKRT